MPADLTQLESRLAELERRQQSLLFNHMVAAGAGIMPSKLAATLNSGQTAALISGNTNLEEDIQDILSGAATFDDITISGQNAITFTHATAEIIPGATSLTFRNSADNASNLIISDAGVITLRAALTGVTSITMAGALSGVTTLGLSGILTSTSVAAATDINSGALILDGGLGMAGALWVGGLANIAGAITGQSTLAITSTSTLTGHVGVGGVSNTDIQFYVNGTVGGSAVNSRMSQFGSTFPSSATNQAFVISTAGVLTNAAVTYADVRSISISNIAKPASATYTLQTGLYIEAISGASTNYAIYTNAGAVRFGDVVTMQLSAVTGTDNSDTGLSIRRSAGSAIQMFSGNTATNTIWFGDSDSNFRGALQYNHSGDEMYLFTGASTRVTITATGTTLAGTLTTQAPTGGAGAWMLGIANAVSPTSPNRTVTINIGGTLYYLHAKTTND